MPHPASTHLGQLLDATAERIVGVEQMVMLSADGLLLAMSSGLGRDEGDRFAAVAAGLLGIATGASGPLGGGPVEEVVVQMRDKLLLVMRINAEGLVAALGQSGCDVASLAYEMAVFARTSAPLLDAEARLELQATLER